MTVGSRVRLSHPDLVASPVSDQIEQLLRAHPGEPLWATVGFTSAFGIRWLHERTRPGYGLLTAGFTRTVVAGGR